MPDGPLLRLDKALAAALPESAGLSRSRLQALIAAGAVRAGGAVLRDPAARLAPGTAVTVAVPAPTPLALQPEAIPLDIVFEDADLLVVDKPAGMVVHPAPGAETGTLVHALLAHCGDGLSGIGGALRPGIVHRIDKDTSGLLVVAKSDRAHRGLAADFARHAIDRMYQALCWGVPEPGSPRLRGLPGLTEGPDGLTVARAIARHPTDRKRMAVVAAGGRMAVTHLRVKTRFGPSARPLASAIACRLETGRTHQIRVHLAHIGHPLIGDPVYGRARTPPTGLKPSAVAALKAFSRQALHAGHLGFQHPVTGANLSFDAAPPPDFNTLFTILKTL